LGAVALAFRTELRRRWRSWLAVAVLVAVVGGLVLAAAAAGRRTASAFPDYVADHGFDALAFSAFPLPRIEHLTGVDGWSVIAGPANGAPRCSCTHPINPNDIGVAILPSGTFAPEVLVSGHMPSRPNQVIASYTLAEEEGLHLGSVITVPFYARSQEAAYDGDATPPPPRGPAVSFTVVGFDALETDFPTGGAPEYYLFTPPSLRGELGASTFFQYGYFVRLHGGASGLPRFEAAFQRLQSHGAIFVQAEDVQISAVESSIHPQAVGWWILAGLSALIGLAVIGQTLVRQTSVEGEEYPTMAALGMGRRQLVALGVVRDLAVGFAGALGAVLVAFLLSPIAPLGEAREVGGASAGLRFDPLVLPIGLAAVVVVVVVVGLWPAWSATRTIPRLRAPARSSALAQALAVAGAPPSAVVGVRNALERRSGGSPVPVGSALIGTVFAVMALVGTSVFGASLGHLFATPRLYGDPFAFKTSNGGLGGPPSPLVGALKRNPAVTAVTEGYALPAIQVDQVTVGAIAGNPVKGPLLLSVVSGRVPQTPGEIALGAATMHAVGATLGSLVRVTIPLPTGHSRTALFRVVGQVAFPVLGQVVGLGTGSVFTVAGYLKAACPPGAGHARCVLAATNNGGGLLVGVAPGRAGDAVVAHYLRILGFDASRGAVPASLINFGQAVDFPVIFGVMLAVFGVATLLHLLVVSVARRRRDVGLLKVVGFVNRQVAASVGWQATTLGLVGLAVGIPVGIAVGDVVWRSFASALGVVPVAVVPAWTVVAVSAGVLAVANLVAVGPALAATRARPTDLMRST
jgi:hypothetical protein